ncbi:thy-1 membrane glycoprotein isoform X1 [Grus americana]|uniref:thy-1 membrane glycoprotein isoform X1 n=1 Tax=Grus americana TaxID=9117 RepID=UPI0024088E18|nr:thy-1 membrane glycoprotein isoform X1 [Grus americana]
MVALLGSVASPIVPPRSVGWLVCSYWEHWSFSPTQPASPVPLTFGVCLFSSGERQLDWQLSWKRGLLQISSGTSGLPEPKTPLAVPGDQPLAVTRELLPAPAPRGGKQSLSELAAALPSSPLPSPRPLGLDPGRLVGRGLPYGTVTPGSPQGFLCTITLSSLREHLAAPILPHGTRPGAWPWVGSAAFLQPSLPPVPPCCWEEPMRPLPSLSSLSAFPRLHLRAAGLLATASVRPGPSQGSSRAGRAMLSAARICQPGPAPTPRRSPGSWWAAALASPKPGGSQARSSPAGRGERDPRASPAAPLPRGGHRGRERRKREHPWGEPQPCRATRASQVVPCHHG